jgi:hypothetical protein
MRERRDDGMRPERRSADGEADEERERDEHQHGDRTQR